MSSMLKTTVSREAIHKRFSKNAVTFLKETLKLVQKACLDCQISLSLSQSFTKILLCDSTWWKLHQSLKKDFPGFGGSSSEAHGKLQLVYDFMAGQIEAFKVTAGTENDTVYLSKLLKIVPKGALLIVDLGYFSLEFFSKLCAKGAYFISRLKSTVKVFDPANETEINLLKVLSKSKEKYTEITVTVGVRRRLLTPCRLIAIRVPKEVGNQRRKEYLMKNRRSKKITKLSLKLCDWIIMITNAPNEKIDPEKVLDLYKIRWQIELIFKQLKSTIGIENICCSNKHRMLCEVYGKLIITIIITKLYGYLNCRLWNCEKKELSLEKCFKRFQERMFVLVNMLINDFKEAQMYYIELIKTISKTCIKLKQKSRSSSLQKLCSSSSLHFERVSGDFCYA